MKITRLILGLLLATTVAACSAIPGLPTIPPGWTLTPSITVTPPITPTSTITPTAPPVVRIENADRAFFNGDYPTALALYQTTYQDSSDPVLRAAAKWGEARVQFEDEHYQESLAALQTLITENPESPHIAHAYFLQGLANYRLEHYAEAAASWQTYLELRPGVLDAYTQELRGDAFFAVQDYANTLAAYTASIQAPRLDDGILVDMKIAATRAELGEVDTALALYDGILARATNDFVKAQAAYEAGLMLQGVGRVDEAFGKYRFAVDTYPMSYHSYLSLVQLVEAGAEVDELSRGLVDYYAGQYDVAIAAFDRYLAANPLNDGTAHYYRALALRDLGSHEAAVEAFTTFISNYSSHPRWVEAWGDKAFVQWFHLGLYPNAAQTLLDFVSTVPNTSAAVDYLMAAARIYERDNRLPEAAQTWTRVANDYPGDEQAPTSIFLAGIVHYRLGDFNTALTSFDRSLSLAVRPEEQARAYLWIGKTQQKLGDASAALTSWQQGQIADPSGYYSERSRDLLVERAPFAPPTGTNLSIDILAERRDADAWVRLTFGLPAETDLTGPGTLASDPRLIRGTELWELGLLDDARLEFESLRESVNANAVDTYRLANYMFDLGLYRPAIFAARQTLTLAGLDDHTESMMAPPYFSHLRYGLYYPDLIIPDAQAEGFDPLFMFSVVRQESLFEGFVRSTAGARGLMQIVPSTGASIASQLGWPFNYNENDLYRPDVSVRFGTHYLATNRDLLHGDIYAALAAYNGGPGNAVIWKQLAGDDPDLFLEIVRFEETRNYIRNIYEIFIIYRRLYSQVN
jgi:soluble lytic murein transglycosylase